jgi:hypothetical protein
MNRSSGQQETPEGQDKSNRVYSHREHLIQNRHARLAECGTRMEMRAFFSYAAEVGGQTAVQHSQSAQRHGCERGDVRG